MALSVEWFRQIVDQIGVSDRRNELLLELKVALSGLSASEVKSIGTALSLKNIFDALNTSDKNQIEAAREVLNKFFFSLDSTFVLSQYGPEIQRSLVHPSPAVKAMILKEVYQAVKDNANIVDQLSKEQELLVLIVQCLCDEDLSLAQVAASLIKSLGSSSCGLSTLFSPAITTALNTVASKDDVYRFRVYEILVDVSAQSETGLKASVESGLLEGLLNELKNDDILTQLNALELLTSLALTCHGLQFLDQHNILETFATKLINAQNDALSSLIIPGLIKFFGNIAQSRPDIMGNRFPQLVPMMLGTLDSPDTTLAGIGMETVGYIGTSLQGKYMLDNLGGEKVTEMLKRMVEKIPSLPSEVRVRYVNVISNLIQLKKSDQNNQSLSLTKRWFDSLSSHPMDIITTMCHQPFPEMRLAGFQLLQVLADLPWGQEYIAEGAGMIEYLLDRSTESFKNCKDAKFHVIQTLVESESSPTVFSAGVFNRLQEFMKQGEFYVPGTTEVGIEGAP